ncbi:MAG: 50S ribosomal protein L12 [Candidatus Pacearchaeota archaeon]
MEYVYAALLLHKLGKDVNEEGIKKVVEATGVKIDSDAETKVKSLVASLKDVDIEKELESASLASVSAAPAAEGKEGGEEDKKEEKEEKAEAAAEGLGALFG